MSSGRGLWSSSTARWARRLRGWWPVAAVAVALVVGWVAAGLWTSGFGTANLRLGEQFAGTVTQVNSDGSAFCMTQEPGGQQRCSSAFQLVGSPHLQVGQHVEVASAVIWPQGNPIGTEVYIVTAPAPQASPNGGNGSAAGP
jgi:hypothetical protein